MHLFVFLLLLDFQPFLTFSLSNVYSFQKEKQPQVTFMLLKLLPHLQSPLEDVLSPTPEGILSCLCCRYTGSQEGLDSFLPAHTGFLSAGTASGTRGDCPHWDHLRVSRTLGTARGRGCWECPGQRLGLSALTSSPGHLVGDSPR